MGDQITVGIDIGTTSVKAVAVDAEGDILARARIPHDLHAPSPDVFEHDARQAWVDGPRTAFAALGVPGLGDLAGIGIASLTPSFTAVDADGIPLTPGLLYGDHRGRGRHDPADPLNSGEFRSMLEWTITEAPDAHGFWPAAAVAGVALGGLPVVDLGTGFALAPLWNGEWDAAQLAALDVRPEQLPIVTAADIVAGQIGDAVQVAGIADAWAEATVSGAESPGDALVICGTTLIVWCIVDAAATVPGLWTLPHPLSGGRHMVAGASNAGGMFIGWANRTIAADSGRVDPRAVPVWVPYLRGERSPLHDATLRASLHGVDLSHGPAALRRAAYEASAFVARRMIQAAAPETRRIVSSGGGGYDDAWMQALADCTGLPVDVVGVPEGAALGAAWHARVGAGLDQLGDAGRWARIGRRVDPDPAWIAPCDERYRRWLDLAG